MGFQHDGRTTKSKGGVFVVTGTKKPIPEPDKKWVTQTLARILSTGKFPIARAHEAEAWLEWYQRTFYFTDDRQIHHRLCEHSVTKALTCLDTSCIGIVLFIPPQGMMEALNDMGEMEDAHWIEQITSAKPQLIH